MNDQPKHTTGDWLAKRAEGGGYIEWYVGMDGEALAIASDIIDPETGQPSEANARLISAAPDLLEALNNLMWIVERAGVESTSTWEPFQSWTFRDDKVSAKEKIDFARAAIAKAEGRGE